MAIEYRSKKTEHGGARTLKLSIMITKDPSARASYFASHYGLGFVQLLMRSKKRKKSKKPPQSYQSPGLLPHPPVNTTEIHYDSIKAKLEKSHCPFQAIQFPPHSSILLPLKLHKVGNGTPQPESEGTLHHRAKPLI